MKTHCSAVAEAVLIVILHLIKRPISWIKKYIIHLIYLRCVVCIGRFRFSGQTNGTVVHENRPSILNEPTRPFGVSGADNVSLCICYRYVFCHGCLPLSQKIVCGAVFCYGCRPQAASANYHRIKFIFELCTHYSIGKKRKQEKDVRCTKYDVKRKRCRGRQNSL